MSLIIHGLVYDRRMAGRPKANLELTETQRQELEAMARAGTSEKRMVFRARLILECASGADNVQVAKTLGTSQQTVTFWRGRFLREGMGGLAELARSGRPERIKPSLKGRILSEAVRPAGGLGRWSTPVRWPSMWEYPRPPCSASGPPTTLSRIGRGSLNCRVTSDSKPSSGTSLEFISIRQIMRWCSAAMRKASVRRCSVDNPACPKAKAISGR